MEAEGYTFEAADASFELLLREEVDGARPAYFDVESLARHHRVAAGPARRVSEATVKLRAGGERIVATGEGNGPVNALDHALRQALRPGLPGARAARAHRLQGPHPRPAPRHGRGHARADRDQRRHASSWETVGRRARTSSRRRGRRSSTGSPTACAGTARPPPEVYALTALRIARATTSTAVISSASVSSVAVPVETANTVSPS